MFGFNKPWAEPKDLDANFLDARTAYANNFQRGTEYYRENGGNKHFVTADLAYWHITPSDEDKLVAILTRLYGTHEKEDMIRCFLGGYFNIMKQNGHKFDARLEDARSTISWFLLPSGSGGACEQFFSASEAKFCVRQLHKALKAFYDICTAPQDVLNGS